MSDFMEDRQLFFSQAGDKHQAAHSKSLAFLTKNHVEIEAEKANLKATLDALQIKSDIAAHNKQKEQYRLYYLYYCDLLRTYHEKRGEPEQPPQDWITYLHDNLGYWHALRILLTFARLTDELAIRMLNDAKWFETLNRSIAPIFDFNQTINILSLPVEAFYVLSFSLLGIRFIIEWARILKHTFDPTEEEIKALSAWDRFCHEVYKYRFNLANDFVWATINAINNNPLMLVCVLFDLSLLLYRRNETEQAYQKKKTEYEQLQALKQQDKIIKQQLRELELEHISTKSILDLALIATSHLLIGFPMLLLATPSSLLAPLGSFLCVVGFAIYLSADFYGDYQKKAHLIKLLEADGKSITEINQTKQAQQAAWDNGWSTFAKNTCMPILFIGMLAVCWPAALLLITAYCAYEMSPKESTETPQLSPA